jgi:biopolymer transport protein ExbD
MKFPRSAKIFHGQLDVAPFAGVFFLLILFVLLGALVYTPGVHISLPLAADLPGTDQPLVAVAVDADGHLYFENQLVSEDLLRLRLVKAVKRSGAPLTLLVQADKNVNYAMLIKLALLARDTGMKDALLATLPETSAPAAPARP